MGRKHRSRYVVALLVLAVGVAGCAEEPPSTDDFVAQVNAICQEHRSTIDAAAGEVLAEGQVPDAEQIGQLAQETIIPELSAQFEELRGLEPPEEVAEEYEAFLEEGQEAVETLEEDPAAIADPATFSEANELADEVGLSDACRIGPS